MTTHAAQVVALGVKEKALEHAAGILNGWRIARAQLAVDIFEGLVLVVGGIFFEGFDDRIVVLRVNDLHGFVAQADQLTNNGCRERFKGASNSDLSVADIGDENLGGDFLLVELLAEFEVLCFVEKIDDLLVGREAHGAKESRGKKFTTALAAVEVDIEEVCGIELNFDPRTTVGNDAEAMEDFSIGVDRCLKANAGRAVELGNDDALGTIDHEGALGSHQRQLAHVNFLFLRATLVFVTEGHIERGAEGLALALALQGGHFGLAELVAYEIEGRFVFKAKDGKKFAEDSLQTDVAAFAGRDILLKELVVGVDLQFDEVWWLDGLCQFSEMNAFRHVFLRCRGLFGLIQGRGHQFLRQSKKLRDRTRLDFPEFPMADAKMFLWAKEQMGVFCW